MARNLEFYKGRRKKKNLAIIPFIVLLALVSVTLVTFYGMQKYAVITKDGVSVELPILDDGSKQVTVDSQGNEVVNFEKVDANIVFDAPDYSTVQASVGENVPELRAIFVPAENITQEKLNEYAAREIPLDDIADAQGLDFDTLLDDIEAIIYSGTKLNIDYFLEDVMDEDKVDEIYYYFLTSTSDSINEALDEFDGEDISEEEIRLVRIKFLSENAN